jgi:isoleucyl-tRNA synthetase
MSEHRSSLPQKEKETLEFWEKNNIFKKTLEKDSPKGPFVFFEGPPTANGRPGIHHAEARAYKDVIPRFRTMQGYLVNRKAGWDTHGLPVELEVEKRLGFKNKIDIENFGIEKFNEECKKSVWTYLEEWQEFTKRLGYWVDMEDPYITYKPEYIESLWSIIKKVWDKGLLYKDYRVTPHCPRCETSLSSHELSQGYKDVKDLSVTAKFKVEGKENEYIIAWTTTPWTLPGNVALAVGEKLSYVKVSVQAEDAEGSEVWIMGEDAWNKKYKAEVEVKGWKVLSVEAVKGVDLVGMKYEPLYDFLKEAADDENKVKIEEKAYQVCAADFVTTEDGSGVVHTAVMYGVDDFNLGNEIGLPKVHTVNLDGKFIEQAGFLAGRFVVDEDVAVDVIKDLAGRGLLFGKEKYEHSYPHCWRCKTKMIYYAKDSWYIRMTELREKLIEENGKINWEPSHIKDGRFGEWLREVKDWAFSRERYWGTPLPIWECQECDHQTCIGDFDELRSSALQEVSAEFDPHRPYVDEVEVKCEKCGGVSRRVPDVCDVWFDSGAMPFAQWHYPRHNKEKIDEGVAYPADYISEAIDQTRGWFYTLLAVAVLLDKEAPYKNCICLGHVLDNKGKKMSKSLGNIVLPMEMMDKYGADAVRWYMYTINSPGEGKRFDEKTLSDMVKKNFNLLMNVTRFYEMFADQAGEVGAPTHVMDRWVLARLHKLTGEMTKNLENYKVMESARAITEFINDLSTWFVRRSRDRFKGTDEVDKQSAINTLQTCLETLSRLMAPFTPFIAETVYGRVGGKEESVHLASWPVVDESLLDDALLDEMGRVRSIVSRAMERRAEAGINVRQALGGMTVWRPSGELEEIFIEVIKDEVNVHGVIVEKGDYRVELDTNLTPALIREGTTREIIRRLNAMRKNNKLTIEDKIDVYVESVEEEVRMALEEHKDVLLHGVQGVELQTGGDRPEINETLRINEFEITLGFTKKE